MMSFITGFLPPWLHIIISLVGFGGLVLAATLLPAYKGVIKIVALVLAVGLVYYAGYNNANESGKEEAVKQANIAKIKYDALVASYEKATREANTLAEEKTAVLKTTIDSIASNYNRVLKESNDKIKVLRATAKTESVVGKDSSGRDIISTTGGLSINASSCTGPDTSNRVQAPSDPAASGGAQEKTEARLDGKTSGDLISIVADGDAAIVQLNAVIDAYNRVQESGCTIVPAPITKPKP